MNRDEEQDIEPTDDQDDAPDLDVDGADEADPDAGVPAARGRGDRRFQKLANENRDLRDRIARMEGAIQAHGQQAPAEPQFDNDQEEFNYKLLQHSKALEAKLKRLEEKDNAAEAAKKQEKIISRAVNGLGFGQQGSFAREHLGLYLKLNPDTDPDDLRVYAQRLAKQMGIKSTKDYVDEKKADQQMTKRPSQSVQPTAPKPNEAKLSAQERLTKTREAALAKLKAATDQ